MGLLEKWHEKHPAPPPPAAVLVPDLPAPSTSTPARIPTTAPAVLGTPDPAPVELFDVEEMAANLAEKMTARAALFGKVGEGVTRLRMTSPLVPGGPFWLVVERTGSPREITARDLLDVVNLQARTGFKIQTLDLFQGGGKNE